MASGRSKLVLIALLVAAIPVAFLLGVHSRDRGDLREWLNTVAAWLTVATALGAVAYAHIQIRQARSIDEESRKFAREMDALNAYERYHNTILEYPEFGRDFDWHKATPEKRAQYEVFLLAMMATIERVLTLVPGDKNWENSLKDDLRLHREFLCSEYWESECEQLIAPDLAAFIRATANEKGWAYPYSAQNPKVSGSTP